jgi:hypothetical protein
MNHTAIPLLTTPMDYLMNDAPAHNRLRAKRYSASPILFALEGGNGEIGAVADCVRHENGYQTVNNPPGRAYDGRSESFESGHGAREIATQVQHAYLLGANQQQDLRL